MADPTARAASSRRGATDFDERVAAIFGGDPATHKARPRTRGRMLAGLITVVVAAVVLVTAQMIGADTAGYRLGTAAVQDVTATMTRVATIEPVSQATVAFPVSGTVATVDVAEGDTVAVGQRLATLDLEALNEDLHDKQAQLAQAELTLAKALDGEDVSGSGSSSDTGAVTPMSTSTASAEVTTATLYSTAVTAAGGSADTELADAQQAVLDAQQEVDAALAAASTALASASDVCATVGESQDEETAAAALTACETALTEVLTLQQDVAAAQSRLADASSELDALLAERAANTPTPDDSSGDSGAPSSSSASGASPSTGTPSNANASPSSSSPSAADLAKYQQAVDAAAVEVIVAAQAINQAEIVSPIAGTVASVDLAVGDDVTSGSTDAHIVVVGPGGYEASTTVSVDDVDAVELGQAATVIPDGGGRRIAGEVVAISVSPDANASTTSYRVTISLTGPTDDLHIGSTGTVAIVTERVNDVVAVPTSAVTVDGDRATVQVPDGAATKAVDVTVGVVGDTWTELIDGVADGDQVVLADLDEPLPSSATNTANGSQNTNGFGPSTGGPPAGFQFTRPN